jgi:hypothetical protein
MHIPRAEVKDMKQIACSMMALALTCAVVPAFGGDKDPADNNVPQYNVKSEVDFKGTIAKVREVPVGEAFAGIHLTINSFKGGEVLEVFVGPADFLKLMDMKFHPGKDTIGVTGSKVKFEGNDMVLAREVRIGQVILSLRDEKGFPNWLWATRTGISTGGGF